MIGNFIKALGQLGDPKLQSVMWRGVIGAIAAFILLWVLVWWLAVAAPLTVVPGVGWLIEQLGAAFDWIAGGLLTVGLFFVTLFFFPAVLTVVVGLFLEDVADAVEARHYPALEPAQNPPLKDVLVSTVKFAGIAIGLNVLALPLYAVFAFIPPLNLILFYLLNGYLVGREFFELVAMRRVPPREIDMLRRKHRGTVQFAGTIITFLMTIPVLNLFAPVVATAAMVHVFQKLPIQTPTLDGQRTT